MAISLFLMNIISLNVRGIGRLSKRFIVKDFLHLHYADICCLQETKLEMIQPAIWRDIGGTSLDKFVFISAKGSTGGIVIGWNSALLTGALVQVGEFSVTVDFVAKKDNFRWRCTRYMA